MGHAFHGCEYLHPISEYKAEDAASQYSPRPSMGDSVGDNLPMDGITGADYYYGIDGTRVVRDFVECPSQMLGEFVPVWCGACAHSWVGRELVL